MASNSLLRELTRQIEHTDDDPDSDDADGSLDCDEAQEDRGTCPGKLPERQRTLLVDWTGRPAK